MTREEKSKVIEALTQELASLPNEFNYFDPTKQLDNRECGLHN